MSDTPQKNFAGRKTPPPFTHRESAVAGRLGLSRDAVRELRNRHLREGEHFAHQHRRIELSDEAVTILAQACRTDCPPPGSAEPEPGVPRAVTEGPGLNKRTLIGWPDAAGEQGKEVKLKAWNSPEGNQQILIAYLPGTDPRNRFNQVRVRVTSNRHFVKHMEVPARLISLPDLYECTRPAPRERGRW
ncbi:MAG TPA: hypothetical protein VGF13_01110 [Verrucomicrobiae bacterium]|jgi:hypothetical protein